MIEGIAIKELNFYSKVCKNLIAS